MFKFNFLNAQGAARTTSPKAKEGGALRITLLGPPGCGKSSLLVNLPHLIDAGGDTAGFRIVFFPHPLSQLPVDTERPGDMVMSRPLTGVMGRGRAKYEIEISDTVGGLLVSDTDFDETQPLDQWPELFRRTVQSDLLIILLDPSTICDDSRLQAVRRAVARHVSVLMERKPKAMVALAFTKADEYGIAGATRFRLADTPQRREAFHRWCDDMSADRASLAAALKNPTDEASGAIEEIISRAGEMFRDVVQVAGGSSVNAYLVSALPLEPAVVPYPMNRRGMLEIFADFFAHTRARRPRPTVPLWVSGGLFALVMLLYGAAPFVLALLILAVIGAVWLFSRSRAK